MIRSRLVVGVSAFVVVTFAATLLLAFLVPLYTDEIGSKMQLTRTLVEGGRLVTLYPQCGSTFTTPLPLPWYPAAVVYHVIFRYVGLLGLKISGMVVAFGWFAGVWLALRRRVGHPERRLRFFATFIALHAIGLVPLTLVSARSEPTLVIALGLFAAFPFAWSIDSRRTLAGRAVVSAGFLLVVSVFYFSHLKALLFTPFVLVSIALTFGWRRPGWLVLVLGLTLFTAAETHRFARTFTACTDAPKVREIFTILTLDPGRAVRDPVGFAKAGAGNLQKQAAVSVDALSLDPKTFGWLAPDPNAHVPKLVHGVDLAVRAGILALLVGLPVFVLAGTIRGWRHPERRRRCALAVLLVLSAGGHMFLANIWAYYNAPFVIAVLALAALLVAPSFADLEARREGGAPWLIAGGALGLQVFAVVSMVTALVHVGPGLVRQARTEGTVLEGLPAWVPVFGYRTEREKIRAHAASCGIDGDGAHRLVIDDATLFAFERLSEPLHLIYVSDGAMWGNDMPGASNVTFLGRVGASGIISRCAYFPTVLLPTARRANGYCCVGPETFR